MSFVARGPRRSARLAHAAEFRNLETAVHVERMSRYCATLAARIGFSEERVELIKRREHTARPRQDRDSRRRACSNPGHSHLPSGRR